MPRRNKGARLWLRRRRGRKAVWVILDRGREISTDASENDIRAAEAALAKHIDIKRRPNFGDGHPAKVLIADALSEYGEKHAPRTRRPDLIGGAISKLVDFFGSRTAASVTGATCNECSVAGSPDGRPCYSWGCPDQDFDRPTRIGSIERSTSLVLERGKD